MKKVLTILFMVILLASGMQVIIDRHYCGGKLADVKISVTGKLTSCGMEKSESNCPVNPSIDKKCCEDQIFLYSLNSNYLPAYFRLSHPSISRIITPVFIDCNIAGNTYGTELSNWVLPPGYKLKFALTQSEICVFRT